MFGVYDLYDSCDCLMYVEHRYKMNNCIQVIYFLYNIQLQISQK